MDIVYIDMVGYLGDMIFGFSLPYQRNVCLKLEKNLDMKKIFMGIKDKFTYYYKVMAMATRATYIYISYKHFWFGSKFKWNGFLF